MNNLEEEISLREIIDKLWRGKWIIVGITITALLVSFIYSFFIADPVYKGSGKVTVHNVASVPETVQPYISEVTKPEIFEQTMKSTAVIETLIKKESLDISVGKLQDKINIEVPTSEGEETSSLISISMEGSDREQIKTIIDSAISLTKNQLGESIQSRLALLEKEYQSKMEEEDKHITEAIQEFNNIRAGEGLPTIILFQQNATEGQYVLEANEDLLNQLKDMEKTDQIKYEKINKKIESLTSLYNFYSNKYDEVRSISTMNIVDISTNVLSDTFVSTNPVSPNKMLNLTISLVLGFILGVGVVFLREYIKGER
ncbi:Wzz/FepE/Etk N-terminal domain-containing protein [Virgibacillus doumboii]|uniref:Wzz/FepE/Etk N-terminal domain-containing protein n=1 Tax=Virgibacillus doumboii TaxID=2697503 RepID=UPI0013DF3595|nr:Wzz/FepE/Etk N-terminal domain-containing protein [Virgibacillus doumboii]